MVVVAEAVAGVMTAALAGDLEDGAVEEVLLLTMVEEVEVDWS